MKDKLPNIIMEGKSPTIRIFNIRVLFSLDEERGYLLDTEEMRRQFEEKLSKLEDEVSELNDTWQEKQKEYAEDMRTCNGVPVPSVSSVLDYQNWRRVGKTEGENNGE
tara:strand:+ start:228 stop:551 length:324 start_codon:yes stop_codon:yes gene_type:complete